MAVRAVDLPAVNLCECCFEPCDDAESWATAIDGGSAHHSCLRDHGVCGTLIDERANEPADPLDNGPT